MNTPNYQRVWYKLNGVEFCGVFRSTNHLVRFAQNEINNNMKVYQFIRSEKLTFEQYNACSKNR